MFTRGTRAGYCGSVLPTSGLARRRRAIRAALSAALAATLTATVTTGLTGSPATAQDAPRQVSYQQWTTGAQLGTGTFHGTRTVRGSLHLARPVGTRSYDDPFGKPTKRYAYGRWTSRWETPGFAFDELVASWDAVTPRDSWVRVQVRGRTESGQRSSWDTLASWAAGDARFHRTSHGAQSDDLARVNVDTWRANHSTGFGSWQLRVTLLRRAGTTADPSVQTVGAMSSRLPAVSRVATSRTGIANGTVLTVPRYSQMIHEGDYPEYDNGGEAWCSPTSVSMVLGYHGRLPSPEEYAWVKSPHPNRFVDHAARSTFDYEYDGAGNWPFSTAYAAQHADAGFVTRLRSLREAEMFIRAGIPLVASVAFGNGELDGSPLTSTNGHLLVISGFRADGDVVVNDPAAPRSRGVVRTYDRGQFENAWLPESGGLVYVVRTAARPLPASPVGNW